MNNLSLIDHFKQLAKFSGRENNRSFWPYAAIIVGVVLLLFMLSFIPIMNKAIATAQQFAAEHPDQVTVSQGPGQYSLSVHGPGAPSLFSAHDLFLSLGLVFGLSIILLAAAIVRRLHDTGKAGWWALMPMPFIVYSTVMMPLMFDRASRPTSDDFPLGLFFSVFLSNLLYMVALVTLIILLTGKSQIDRKLDGTDTLADT